MSWMPHVTVATVVEDKGKFLMVEEYNPLGELVLNQPAGHLEQHESLIEAAIRETLEETAWHISIRGLLGTGLYTSPFNGVTYYRTSFIGDPIRESGQSLDQDIVRALWLSYEEIRQREHQLRSELVIRDLDRYLQGLCYPLAIIEP